MRNVGNYFQVCGKPMGKKSPNKRLKAYGRHTYIYKYINTYILSALIVRCLIVVYAYF